MTTTPDAFTADGRPTRDSAALNVLLPHARPLALGVLQELLDCGAIDSDASMLSLEDGGSVRPNAWGGFDLGDIRVTRVHFDDTDVHVTRLDDSGVVFGGARFYGALASVELIFAVVLELTGFGEYLRH